MNHRSLSTALLALGLLPGVVHAQVSDPLPAEGAVVALEWSKPFMDGGDYGFATSTLMARILVPAGEGRRFLANWGVSHGSLSGASSTSLSNLEVGLAFLDEELEETARVSVVAPLASEFGDDDFSVFTGAATDFERADRFVPDMWTLHAMGRPTFGAVRGHIGASYRIPDEGDSELFAHYGLSGRTGGSVRLGVELSGLAILSESDLDLGERTLHQIAASVGWGEGSVLPELFLRVPIDDDLGEVVNAVAGIRLTF